MFVLHGYTGLQITVGGVFSIQLHNKLHSVDTLPLHIHPFLDLVESMTDYLRLRLRRELALCQRSFKITRPDRLREGFVQRQIRTE